MEDEKLPYLTNEEIRRMKDILYEMTDALDAITAEVYSRPRPYKGYIEEKLRTLEIDVPCIKSMIELD